MELVQVLKGRVVLGEFEGICKDRPIFWVPAELFQKLANVILIEMIEER